MILLYLFSLLFVRDANSTHVFFYDLCVFFFFQAEDGLRCLVRSRGLGYVYERFGLAAFGRPGVRQP